MRRTTRLKKIRRTLLTQLNRLRRDIQGIPPNATLRDIEKVVGYVTIQLLNVWSNFMRGYFLACMAQAKKCGGGWITIANPGLSLNQCIGRAVLYYNPGAVPNAVGEYQRRLEPKWYLSNTLLELSVSERFSNTSDIAAALSISTRVFVDLPVFRNYFAHKNQHSRRAASNLAPNYGIGVLNRPSLILLTCPLLRPQRLIYDWMDDLRFVAEYLCH